jgi:hypothetical protein
MSRCCKPQVHAGSLPKGIRLMNNQPTHSPTLWWLLVGIIDELFIQSLSQKEKPYEPICLLLCARVSSECVSELLWWKKNWGKITHKNWLLRQNSTQEYFTIIKSPMQMHSFLKSFLSFPGVWKRKPFSRCLLQHTKAHFGWVQGRLNAYDSCCFCFYFHKFIYLFCLSTHHLSTFLKANQFGLIWSELHPWVQPCLEPFELASWFSKSWALSPFELFSFRVWTNWFSFQNGAMYMQQPWFATFFGDLDSHLNTMGPIYAQVSQ